MIKSMFKFILKFWFPDGKVHTVRPERDIEQRRRPKQRKQPEQSKEPKEIPRWEEPVVFDTNKRWVRDQIFDRNEFHQECVDYRNTLYRQWHH
ncbi:hypothetical protein GCK72_001722 [Caenorhabditis remanei]|uniref:Uncharacterized protein n=2 Tax=Caenorhabditis remanei TaxID=31234 RepID=E3LN38_CAERE|nr:hypothetical protein GCK72_001722 [Caenorhabditis remanei]EFP02918.1 hypothetical protein CRE_28568 [Caenorhabditis remanei]KAF1769905.1 hypothetical protein GCK72_001722 [Caenorhabditis remanei]